MITDVNNSSTNIGNVTPCKELLLSGSQWTLSRVGSKSWKDDVWSKHNIKKLKIEGESGIYSDPAYTPDGDRIARVRPALTIESLERMDKRTTMSVHGFNLRDGSFNREHFGTCSIKNFSQLALESDGSPTNGPVYPIIPWMVVTANDNGYNYQDYGYQNVFATATNNVLISAKYAKTFSSAGEYDNVYFNSKEIALSEDKTINSLSYDTTETPQFLNNLRIGAGRTLTLKSGGMIFCRRTKWFGHPEEIEKSGSVAFGGECAYIHSGYGWANGTSSDYNCMWAKIIATNDLVKAGAGHLVIGGDQRGIDGSIYVNAGVLWLGYPSHGKDGWLYANKPNLCLGACTDVTNFVVRGGAILGISTNGYEVSGEMIPALSPNASLSLMNNGNAYAMLDMPFEVNSLIHKLYIGGKSMPRGTYRASGSGAEFIDDKHFTGLGVLTVRRDDCRHGTCLIVQ